MFIYEKNGAICVTFKSNKPVDAPEYVITIDPVTESVSVNGKQFVDPVEEATEEAVEDTVELDSKEEPVEEDIPEEATEEE